MLAQKLRGLESVHSRHVDIEQDDGELALEHSLESLLSGAGLDDLGIDSLENRAVRQALLGQVVDDEDPRTGRGDSALLRARILLAA